MARKPPARADHLRAAIAQEAARLMAEHGIHDFLLAKRKAAERFGVSDGSVMPRNVEIEEALAGYHRLFGGDAHTRHLRQLREAAVQALDLLSVFEPRLVGPVLSGLATEHDDVQLHVFAQRPESVQLFLLDRHMRFEAVQRRLRLQAHRDPELVPGFAFELEGTLVEALVFPPDGLRQAPPAPGDGRPMRRADAAEVRRLLVEG